MPKASLVEFRNGLIGPLNKNDLDTMRYLYELYHIHEVLEDGEESNVKVLGVFSSRQKAEKAIERYKDLPGFKDKSKIYRGCEYRAGFFIDIAEVDREEWSEGYTTVGEIMSSLGTVIDHEAEEDEALSEEAINIPYWASEQLPKADESGETFAQRLLAVQWGPNNYPTGPGSEFFQVKQWVDSSIKE